MPMFVSLGAVLALVVLATVLAQAGLHSLLGIYLPYAAVAVFIGGFGYRVVEWARSPVPFRIPTTCGQQESLPWIKQDKLESPSTLMGVLGRMFLEVFFFRSLFRNTKAEAIKGPRLVYASDKVLWLAGLAFHYSFLVILLRHFRLFVTDVPVFIGWIENLDGFIQLTLPAFYITDAVIVGAVTYLFIRRVIVPQVRYISLAADYFPLFLILAIAISGILMRYGFFVSKVNVAGAKAMVAGLFALHPVVTEGIGAIFYVHVALVSMLLIYFPMSKLMHMGGVFMSPTRNLANNSRMVRHINPWNPKVKFHTYEEYENDFRKVMKSAGLPLEKDEDEPSKKEG